MRLSKNVILMKTNSWLSHMLFGIENKGATYVDAVVMEGLTGVEFVRRVVLISGQELTPKFAVNIRRCRQIEGETRHSLDAGDGAVDERGNES